MTPFESRPAIDVVADEADGVAGRERQAARAAPPARAGQPWMSPIAKRRPPLMTSVLATSAASASSSLEDAQRGAVGIDVAAPHRRHERAEAVRIARVSPASSRRRISSSRMSSSSPARRAAARSGPLGVVADERRDAARAPRTTASTPCRSTPSWAAPGSLHGDGGRRCSICSSSDTIRSRAVAVGLVHHEDVGDLEQARLHHLHRVARLGHQDDDDRVGEPHDVELGLPHPDRLDQHDVHAERIQQTDDVARGARQAAVAAARGEAADEDAGIEEVRLHADAVAQHGAARERARRVDRDDADAAARGAQAPRSARRPASTCRRPADR